MIPKCKKCGSNLVPCDCVEIKLPEETKATKPTLYIVRGIPGSGKSTLARKLVHESKHREADMYFMEDGEYKFNPKELKSAHEWCQHEIEYMMEVEKADCAVSNTFIKHWEYQFYLDIAEKFGYNVQVIECHADFGNTHNVPEKSIERMKRNWEPTKI